jgi:hypothetical protein
VWSTEVAAARKNGAHAATKADKSRARKSRAQIIARLKDLKRNRLSRRRRLRKINQVALRNRMKLVHAASVAGIAAVVAAARAINGQLQLKLSAARVARQKLPESQHRNRALNGARRLIHLKIRGRRAGNRRLRPL